jgi:hypothetical protein
MDSSRRNFIGASLAAVGSAGAVAAPVEKPNEEVNIRAFGAVGDGVTNDRAAFAAAVAAGRGRRIRVPAGNYRIDADAGSITLEEVDLVGEGVLDGATGSIDRGVNLWITGSAHSPFKVRRGTSVSGLGIYYPRQKDSRSPQAYPATFAFDFSNGPVQFVNFVRTVAYNAWRFIDIDDPGGNVGHVEIIGNYICALDRAIYLRRNTEHLRIERNNFTFGHWLQASEDGARAYMRANATAVQVDQSDGIEFVDNLVFGHLNGLLTSGADLCQFMKIAENKFDQVRYGVRARGPGKFDGQVLGNTFNSMNPQNRGLQSRSVSIETGSPGIESITISGNNFDFSTEEHVYLSGDAPTRRVVIGPNNYRSWAASKTAGAYGALHASGARTGVQVTGGWFFGGNNPLHSCGLSGQMDTLQVTGANFEGCVAALNVTANDVVTTGNCSKATQGPFADTIVSRQILQSGNRWDRPSGTAGH